MGAQVPECVVCLQPYDDYLHVPRVLACGHSLCELCLMQLQSARQPSLTKNKDSQSAVAVIRCPECSQRTKLPIGGAQYLPKNVELLRLLPSLVKEAGFPVERKIDTPEKAGGSKDGKGTRGVAGVGNRKGIERSLESKGKERVDSNGSSVGNSNSTNRWLMPCDLYSENLTADIRTWILPAKAIKPKEDSANFPDVVTCGELILEQTRLPRSLLVTLLRLELRCPQDETLSYEHSVLKAWEDSHDDVKAELLILFRTSSVCRRLCNVFGLWMNPRREVFLVSEIPTQESVSAWEMMRKCSQPSELLPDRLKQQATTESASVTDETSSLPGEMSQTDLKVDISAVSMNLLIRVGVGLCEVLLEVHSQGVILGASSPKSFVLDRFGNLLMNLNKALNDRNSVHEALSSYRTLHDTEATSDDQFEFQRTQNNIQYISPEVLSRLIGKSADSEGAKSSAWDTSSEPSEQVHGRITCKADVYSLGCFLLELIVGKPPYDHLSFHEVLDRVLVKREKPCTLFSLDDFREFGAAESHKHVRSFKDLLSKCFEYDPDDRPEVEAIWLNLVELGSSNIIPKWSSSQDFTSEIPGVADQKYWILCVPGFVRYGSLDTLHTKHSNVQESQRLRENGGPQNELPVDKKELQSCGLELTGALKGHQDFVTALAVCGDHLLSASFDKTIQVWSLEDLELKQTLEGHSQVVVALAVDQDTFRCFSGDNGGKICAWKLGDDTSQPLIASWHDHKDWRYTGVASLAVSADGILYSGSGDRTIKSWSLQNFDLLGKMEGHKSVVSALLVDGELLYSGSWDGTIRIWWRSDHSPVAVLGDTTVAVVPSLGGVRTLCMSDSFLFSGRDNGAIQVWRDEECLTTLTAHDMVVSTLYLEGDFLYTGSWDQQIKAWKVDEFLSDPSPALVKECGSPVSSIVSDGDRLYAGLAGKDVQVYSLLGDTWASLVQMLNP